MSYVSPDDTLPPIPAHIHHAAWTVCPWACEDFVPAPGTIPAQEAQEARDAAAAAAREAQRAETAVVVARNAATGRYPSSVYSSLITQAIAMGSEERVAKAREWFPEGTEDVGFLSDVQSVEKVRTDKDTVAEDAERKRHLDHKRRDQWAAEELRRERMERTLSGDLSEAAKAMRDKMASRLLSADDLDDEPEPEPIIDGWLYTDSVNWLAGKSGTFKSFIGHDLAARFGSTKMTYHGIPMTHGKALYVVAEGAGMFKHRKNAWQHFNGRVENVTYYPMPVQLSDFEAALPALCDIVKSGEFDMVVVDTQAMCSVGIDENTAEGMGVIVAAAHALRQLFNGCIIMVHHFGKSDGAGMRGNSALYAAANTVMVTKREDDWVRLSTRSSDGGKQKDDEERDDLRFKLDVYDPADHNLPGRASLCPLRDDAYAQKQPVVLPTFDQERMDLLKAVTDFEAMGGMSPTAVKEWANEHYPKNGGEGKPYTTSGAEMRAKTLLTAECVEKKGAKYVPTAKGRAVLEAQISWTARYSE